jgi:hypothetical protein
LDDDIEVRLDFSHEPDLLSSQNPPTALQCSQMGSQESRPWLGQSRRRQLGAQLARPPGQRRRIRRGFILDLAAQCRIAGVRVHESLHQAVESQTEQQVLAN